MNGDIDKSTNRDTASNNVVNLIVNNSKQFTITVYTLNHSVGFDWLNCGYYQESKGTWRYPTREGIGNWQLRKTLSLIEGNVEVKFPIIWIDEK